MKIIVSLALVLFCGQLFAKEKPTTEEFKYKIAVVDSGFSPVMFSTAGLKLCKTGHFDFTTGTPTVGEDEIGHGAYVTDIINKYANRTDICFLVYKIFPTNIYKAYDWLNDAIKIAYKNNAKVINLSLSGNSNDAKLKRTLRYVTNNGVKVFVAAGNDSDNMNSTCLIYPQCYKNINKNMVLVGGLNIYGRPAKYSNSGLKLQVWEIGDYSNFTTFARGTSFAAPRAAGNYISKLPKVK